MIDAGLQVQTPSLTTPERSNPKGIPSPFPNPPRYAPQEGTKHVHPAPLTTPQPSTECAPLPPPTVSHPSNLCSLLFQIY